MVMSTNEMGDQTVSIQLIDENPVSSQIAISTIGDEEVEIIKPDASTSQVDSKDVTNNEDLDRQSKGSDNSAAELARRGFQCKRFNSNSEEKENDQTQQVTHSANPSRIDAEHSCEFSTDILETSKSSPSGEWPKQSERYNDLECVEHSRRTTKLASGRGADESDPDSLIARMRDIVSGGSKETTQNIGETETEFSPKTPDANDNKASTESISQLARRSTKHMRYQCSRHHHCHQRQSHQHRPSITSQNSYLATTEDGEPMNRGSHHAYHHHAPHHHHHHHVHQRRHSNQRPATDKDQEVRKQSDTMDTPQSGELNDGDCQKPKVVTSTESKSSISMTSSNVNLQPATDEGSPPVDSFNASNQNIAQEEREPSWPGSNPNWPHHHHHHHHHHRHHRHHPHYHHIHGQPGSSASGGQQAQHGHHQHHHSHHHHHRSYNNRRKRLLLADDAAETGEQAKKPDAPDAGTSSSQIKTSENTIDSQQRQPLRDVTNQASSSGCKLSQVASKQQYSQQHSQQHQHQHHHHHHHSRHGHHHHHHEHVAKVEQTDEARQAQQDQKAKRSHHHHHHHHHRRHHHHHNHATARQRPRSKHRSSSQIHITDQSTDDKLLNQADSSPGTDIVAGNSSNKQTLQSADSDIKMTEIDKALIDDDEDDATEDNLVNKAKQDGDQVVTMDISPKGQAISRTLPMDADQPMETTDSKSIETVRQVSIDRVESQDQSKVKHSSTQATSVHVSTSSGDKIDGGPAGVSIRESGQVSSVTTDVPPDSSIVADSSASQKPVLTTTEPGNDQSSNQKQPNFKQLERDIQSDASKGGVSSDKTLARQLSSSRENSQRDFGGTLGSTSAGGRGLGGQNSRPSGRGVGDDSQLIESLPFQADIFPQPPNRRQSSKQQQIIESAVTNNRRRRLCWCCCCPCASVSTKSKDEINRHNDMKRHSGAAPAAKGFPALPNVPLEEIRSWGDSFDKLMKHPDGRKIFHEFLRCEYSDENILFWNACEEFKKETNHRKMEERAESIYTDYISILSPKEVSLDSRVRDEINKKIKHPTRDIFDEAQIQTYTLMARDSYPRFINSTSYKQLAKLPTSSRRTSA